MASNHHLSLLGIAAKVVGYAVFCKFVYQFFRFAQFNLRSSSLPSYGRSHRLHSASSDQKTHPYALVTGASDGLGLALVEELAAKGFNLVIHGRNSGKLEGIKTNIEAKHNVKVRTLVIDGEKQPTAFNESSYKAFEQAVLDAVNDIPITILVNNIGVLGKWLALDERTASSIDDFINLNIRFTTELTRTILPILKRNKPSLILNVTSTAEWVPAPWAAPYSGAKAYSSAFHRALQYELLLLDMADIEVMSVRYGTICTASAGRTDADATWDIPTAARAARDGLGAVGCGYSNVTPYLGHWLQESMLGLVPESFKDKSIADLLAVQKKRMDALLKKE